MFTTLKYRRHIAVLATLAMVASVMVAAPLAAADDPKVDYPAKFDACMGVESADFEDVPANHDNAGDINCIAYYGITKGTTPAGTTYSPSMSVSREHMALFLTRLADRVGIELPSDPPDAGFTDIGELSAESQTAINQLADLDITHGTNAAGTTYSPDDAVRRGHMALFIARLMDHMKPMAEDKDTVFGYTPEDVVDVADGDDDDDLPDKTVKSPFIDIDGQTKEAYDAITALWELGVASGINDTSYAPGASITRARMAEFMVGVLDHSNARPAGVTIQADPTWEFDSFTSKVAVSYRDDMFKPMVDVSVKVFHSGDDGAGEAGVGSFNEDGGCSMASDCAWTDDESLTDASGNIYIEGGVTNGNTNTYYAWMGDPDADDNDFDVDTSPHATVTLSSTTDAVALKVTSDISMNSTNGNTVDIDATDSVTFTVQLVDIDGDAVAKSGVKINVAVSQNPIVGNEVTLYPAPAPLETDDDGQATYTTSGPKSTKEDDDPDRTDTVTFTSDVDGTDGIENDANLDAGAPDETVVKTILWTDSDSTLVDLASVADVSAAADGSGKGSTPAYAILNSKDEVTIRASVSLYDQYGNSIGKGGKVAITIGDAPVAIRTISSRGVASWRATVDLTAATDNGRNQPVTVQYALQADTATVTALVPLPDAPDITNTMVTAVRHAPDDSSEPAGAIGSPNVDAVYGDDDRFNIDGYLYTYDSDDVFVDGTDNGAVVDVAKFKRLIGANLSAQPTTQANVQVVSYDDDGSSIFRVVEKAAE